MTITTTFTAEEYAALLDATERSGFDNVQAYIYWAVLQQTYELLTGAATD